MISLSISVFPADLWKKVRLSYTLSDSLHFLFQIFHIESFYFIKGTYINLAVQIRRTAPEIISSSLLSPCSFLMASEFNSKPRIKIVKIERCFRTALKNLFLKAVFYLFIQHYTSFRINIHLTTQTRGTEFHFIFI